LDNLDFKSLRETNTKRCESIFHPIDDWSPTDWACAMAGEAGETCNKVKKLKRITDNLKDYQNKPNMLELDIQALKYQISKELADTIIYADLLAARLGIDLGLAVKDKFNQTSDEMNCEIRL